MRLFALVLDAVGRGVALSGVQEFSVNRVYHRGSSVATGFMLPRGAYKSEQSPAQRTEVSLINSSEALNYERSREICGVLNGGAQEERFGLHGCVCTM